jgi:predicted Zn-dependent protease
MYYVRAKEVFENIDGFRKLAEKKMAEANKARGEERQKLKDEAAQYSEEAASLEAKAPEIRLNNLEKSFENLAEAARQSWKPNVQWYAAQQGEELAALYRRSNEDEKAKAIDEQIKKYYETIITYEPKLEDLKVERKDKYVKAEEKLLALAVRLDKLNDAEKVLKRMVSENPDRTDYLTTLLKLYDRGGKTTEKIAYLENAVHDNPMDSHLRAVLADAYDTAGDRQKYMAELRRIEVLDPNNTVALSGLYLANKDNAEAARPYKEKLQKLGVNADELTTIIREGVSTGSLVTPQQPKLGSGREPAAVTTSAASESTASTKAATSATAAAAGLTAPTPVTQTPAPGTKSSDAISTAPGPETTAPAAK